MPLIIAALIFSCLFGFMWETAVLSVDYEPRQNGEGAHEAAHHEARYSEVIGCSRHHVPDDDIEDAVDGTVLFLGISLAVSLAAVPPVLLMAPLPVISLLCLIRCRTDSACEPEPQAEGRRYTMYQMMTSKTP